MSEQTAPVQAPPRAALAQDTARHAQQTVPFPPQGYQAVDVPKPAPFQTTRTFVLGKIALAACNFVFAIVALGVAVGLCVRWTYHDAIIASVIIACVAFASFIWQFADGLTMLLRRSIHRPIHPGAHVGVHLVLWLLALLSVGSLAASVYYESDCQTQESSSYNGYYDGDYGDYYTYCGDDTFSSAADVRRYMGLLEALLAFSVLLLVGEFTLFVLACVETNRRRKYGRMTKVVYVMATAPPVQMSQGATTSAPQHKAGAVGGVTQPQPAVYA